MANMITLETVHGARVEFWVQRVGAETRMLIIDADGLIYEFRHGEANALRDFLSPAILKEEMGVS